MATFGLLVKPDGETVELDAAEVRSVARLLGENHRTLPADSGQASVLVHELWKVADLPINVFASLFSDVVLGGPVVVVSAKGGELPEKYTEPLFRAKIGRQCLDVEQVYKLSQYHAKNRKRNNFIFNPPDRWLYGGKFFDAIVVEGRGAELECAEGQREVWLFKAPGVPPIEVTVGGHPLAHAMEIVMEGDELAAEGNPPKWLQSLL